MLRGLAFTTILLTGADHWTTYLCLHAPVDGWVVVEANPIAGWLFDWAGLDLGLLIDSLVTLTAVAFLATTDILSQPVRTSLLGVIGISTGYAVINNLGAISSMGLASWSGLV